MRGIRLTRAQFIDRAVKVHFDKFTYEKVRYLNNYTKVIITCRSCGDFLQKPSDHLSGRGCILCALARKTSNLHNFKQIANSIHNEKYSYAGGIYKNALTKIAIICPVHGIFYQTPASHLSGWGCLKCRDDASTANVTDFVRKAQEIHHHRYDYSKVIYKNTKSKIIISCLLHGDFLQTPNSHLTGRGCGKCSESKGEIFNRQFLDENNISYHRQFWIKECRDVKPLRFDFAIKQYDQLLGLIEFNGDQHYEPIIHFGGQDAFTRLQKHDRIKVEYCNKNQIPLLIIRQTTDNVISKLQTFISKMQQ